VEEKALIATESFRDVGEWVTARADRLTNPFVAVAGLSALHRQD
jgi:hypothetical protein